MYAQKFINIHVQYFSVSQSRINPISNSYKIQMNLPTIQHDQLQPAVQLSIEKKMITMIEEYLCYSNLS